MIDAGRWVANNPGGLVGMMGRSTTGGIPSEYERNQKEVRSRGSLEPIKQPGFVENVQAPYQRGIYIDNRQLTGSATGKYNIAVAELEAEYPADFV